MTLPVHHLLDKDLDKTHSFFNMDFINLHFLLSYFFISSFLNLESSSMNLRLLFVNVHLNYYEGLEYLHM